MELKLRSFEQIVQDMGAALRGSASALVDLSVGSVVRAVLEANAGVALWMQWLILQLLASSRAATSVGCDLDTWMADFGVKRLEAVPATGVVTVSRLSTSSAVVVPAGMCLKTSDGSLTYSVRADPTLSTWQPHASGYVMPAGVSGIDLPVECLSPGAAGNVTSSAITLIASPIAGVDRVRNDLAFTNGFDTESDDALRGRFRAFMASLAKATPASVAAAVASVRQGLAFVIKENMTIDGTATPGAFLVVVDDGEGTLSPDLLASVANAVEATRPIGTTFNVVPPKVQAIDVSAHVYIQAGQPLPHVSLIQDLISTYINMLPIEAKASITRIAQSIYSGCSNVCNVANISLNGEMTDLAAAPMTVFKAGLVTVTLHGG